MKVRVPAIGRSLLPQGAVARNLAVVGGATVIGQGAVVLAAPLLARLYVPEAFGVFSVYMALLSVLVAGSSLRYDLSIPLARDASEAVHLLAVSILAAVGVSVGLGLIVLVAGTSIAAALGAPPLAPFLWLLPVTLLVASLAQAVSGWALYERSFTALARMRSTQGLAQVVGQVIFGISQVGTFGLLLGDAVGRVFGLGELVRPLAAALRETRPTRAGLRRYAAEHWGFARVMTVASLLNAVSLSVPFLLIPLLFDLASSGQYFLAHRLLVLPASLVAAAVSQVFFGEASFRRADPRRLHDLALNASVSLLVFSIPTYAILLVSGQALITTVFGASWSDAGLYAQISAPWLIVWSVASPISSLLLVGRRERESLAFTAAELGLKVGALLVGAAVHSLTVGVVVLTIVSVAINVSALWRFLRVAAVSLRELVAPAARIAGIAAPFVAAVALVAVLNAPLLIIACPLAWLAAVGLAVRVSPEPRALLSGTHD